MKPNTKLREVSSGGVEKTGEFGISMNDAAHIMTILRDTLYSDKILAVLREYSANAWDAHRSIGKHDVPIEVHIPTSIDSQLRIRDFGPGLSPDDVFNVFTQYGASTKRGNDVTVGMLGIGSKSGFAYSDSFTIVSWHGGKKRVYAAVLDPSDKGLINFLHEEDCGEETGVEIQIAVRPSDIEAFAERAQNLFRFFVPRPTVNVVVPTLPETQTILKRGVIFPESQWNHSGWFAVMGCIPYKIDLRQLSTHNLGTFYSNMSGALFLEIGDVQVNASREELKYSDATNAIIASRMVELVDEFVSFTLSTVKATGTSAWDRRLKAQILSRMHLPVPEESADLVSSFVPTFGTLPTSFEISKDGSRDHIKLHVNPHTRLILRDVNRSLSKYHISHSDYIVRRKNKTPMKDVEADLATWIKDRNIEGIPVVKLSEMPFHTSTIPDRGINPKHRVRTFCFSPAYTGRCYAPFSQHWSIVNRAPEDTDVFVVLDAFEAVGFSLYESLAEDIEIVKLLGAKMPPIYGYKTTLAKPIRKSDLKGQSYEEWCKSGFHKLFDKEKVAELLKLWAYFEEGDPEHNFHWRNKSYPKQDTTKFLLKEYGKDHPITKLFFSFLKATKALFRTPKDHYSVAEKISRLIPRLREIAPNNEADALIQDIKSIYPLVTVTDFEEIWLGSNKSKWLHYIKTIDAVLGGRHDRKAAPVHDDERNDHRRSERKTDDREEGNSAVPEPSASTDGGELGRGSESPDPREEPERLGERQVRSEGRDDSLQRGGAAA